MRRIVVGLGLLVGCASASAQGPAAWRPHRGSGVCVASTSTAGSPELGAPSGCREIEIGSDAWTRAETLLRPSGPHRYAIDPITTAAERAHRPDACCYQVQYPPPPPG
jgi:hypothetical protein